MSFAKLAIVLSSIAAVSARAETPARQAAIQQVIDSHIAARLKEAGVVAAPAADDSELVRRLCLDLAGRIPASSEARAFVSSTDRNKRAALVDRLMASETFDEHLADEFDALFRGDGNSSMRDYLRKAFRERRSWDRVFREVVSADTTDKDAAGADVFLKSRIADIDRLATDVSVTFFGVNISCAQCHDHPFVGEWSQNQYYGMKSFFSRTFENGGFVAERSYGATEFKDTKARTHIAPPRFLDGAEVTEAAGAEPSEKEKQAEKKLLEQLKKDKKPAPAPKYSRRAKLIEVALAPDKRMFFARSIVNRLWARLLGYGLVMPLDQLHSANPSSHPELLEWLAEDLVAGKFDLRRTIRGIVLSDVYARSSRWTQGQRPARSLFAVAETRALTPMQYAVSLELATADPASFDGDASAAEFRQRFDKKIESARSTGRRWTSMFQQPEEDLQIAVDEALQFSNDRRMFADLLGAAGKLPAHLEKIEDDRAMLEAMMWAVASRPPEADEVTVIAGYLAQRKDRRPSAIRQIIWSLLTGPEFRFNH